MGSEQVPTPNLTINCIVNFYFFQAGDVTKAVKNAIDCGYRHFDCADSYGTENEIGDGIQSKMTDGTVTREDLFVTTKVFNK